MQVINSFSCAYGLDNVEVISVNPVKFSGTVIIVTEEKCKNWRLSKQEIIGIFHFSEESTYIGLTDFAFVPCEITGKLKLKNQILNFNINAGYTATIQKGKDLIFYGCAKKECNKFFIN